MKKTFELDEKILGRIAAASKLELSDVKRFSAQIGDILGAFSDIDSADTEGIEPSFHPVRIDAELRDDSAEASLSQEQALMNSRNNKDGYFKGPKVI